MEQTPRSRAPAIAVDRRPAPDGTDAATRETVLMMCGYIRDSVSDPLVQRCAQYAWRTFGSGVDDATAKCWAVFWWAKHCVKFRLDEATMFRIGERQEHDLLISPAVLVRMRYPAEDCDGFTMLVAAMCSILGVDVVIATVAADGRDPGRWSHVFPCAILPNDQVLPLDASHGVAPGWMVPPEHIFRWQAFNLDGELVDVGPAAFQGLHNYARGGSSLGEYGSVPSGSSWNDVLKNLAAQGVEIFDKVVTPPAYQSTAFDSGGNLLQTTVRNTATPTTAGAAAAAPGGISNTLLLGGFGLLGLLVVVSMNRGRR